MRSNRGVIIATLGTRLENLVPRVDSCEGHFTHWKERARFFQNKRSSAGF